MGAQFVKRAAASLGIVALLWSVMGTGVVRAAENETFGLTPYPERANGVVRRTFAIPLDRGATFEDAIRVYNRTDQPLDLLIYAADARAANDGSISVAFRGSRPAGLAAWIDLSLTSVSLPRRASAIVGFRVKVGSARPSPDLGAIVVENAARGIRAELVRRLHVVVRTTPAGGSTTSTRVRSFTLLSGWTIAAIAGLVAAGALVWLARRRGRRSRQDDAPGTDDGKRADETPEASRPVLHRFGKADTDPKLVALGTESRPDSRLRRPPRRRPERDERPLLDEVAFIEDEEELETDAETTDEVELEPKPKPARAPKPKPKPKPPPKKQAPSQKKKAPEPDDKKLDYIPLDDL